MHSIKHKNETKEAEIVKSTGKYFFVLAMNFELSSFEGNLTDLSGTRSVVLNVRSFSYPKKANLFSFETSFLENF